MKVGTLPWLLRNDLLLWWRGFNRKNTTLIVISFGFLLASLFFLLWLALGSIRSALSQTTIPSEAVAIAVLLWVIGFFLAFTQAMGHSLVALFERGDLDLLVSSPIESEIIFASRLLGVALKVFLSSCWLIVPISLLALLGGIPQLLGLYPFSIGLSLIAASLAILLTLGLVHLLGAKRARIFAQILTTFLTVLFFLAFQLPSLTRGNIQIINWQYLQAWFKPENPLSFIWFPVKALFFDPLAVLLTLLISSAIAWLTIRVLHRSFMAGTQQSVTQKHQRLRSKEQTNFTTSFNRLVLNKEWRLIWRNPYLISNVFMQLLFLIPAVIVVLQGNTSRAVAGLPAFAIVSSVGIGGSLTMSLTRICVSGEEASDLLKSSPANSVKLRSLKLLAALIPVWLLFSPLFMILIVKGENWLIPLIVFLAASTCAAILRLWNSRPISLTDMFSRRNNQDNVLLTMMEVLLLWMWGWLGFTLLHGNNMLVLIQLGVIGLIVAIAYGRSRQLGTSLGF